MRLSIMALAAVLGLMACDRADDGTSADKLEVTLPRRTVGRNCSGIVRPAPVELCPVEYDGSLCRDHADCQEGANGRCVGEPLSESCYCQYDECQADSDCRDNWTCACAGEEYAGVSNRGINNRCLRGNCRSDADCGEQGACLAYRGHACDTSLIDKQSGIPVWGWYCSAPDDECRGDTPCDTSLGLFCVSEVNIHDSNHFETNPLKCQKPSVGECGE